MTSREAFEHTLTEINKVEAASLLVSDFVYLFNKAIQNRINKDVALFEVNQQLTDNLRVLRTGSFIPVTESDNISNKYGGIPSMACTYEVNLPSDYLHFLGCRCIFTTSEKIGCNDAGNVIESLARKMTSANSNSVENNAYFKPSHKTPYWYLTHINSSTGLPTNPYSASDAGSGLGTGVDGALSRTIKIGNIQQSVIDRTATVRYGNASTVRLELRCGKDTRYKLTNLIVEYLKTPQYVDLTQEQLDLVEDTSQILEWPDYICYQIVNELATLVLENSGDPRLQTFIPINQTIAPPIQQESIKTKK